MDFSFFYYLKDVLFIFSVHTDAGEKVTNALFREYYTSDAYDGLRLLGSMDAWTSRSFKQGHGVGFINN